MLWIMNGRSDNSVHLIAFAFAPAIACFVLGQTSIFVLFGLTSFLYFHQTKPYLAGAALALCALKPHLFLPFWVALFAWAITRKAYELAATAASTLVVCAAIPMVFDHSIYSQYSMMARSSGVKTELIPTLSEFLRIVVAPNSLWLQFLPAFAGCIWASWYFQRHSREWDWYRDGSLVILIAFVVAPYAWYFDAAVVLPSLLYAAYRARPRALAVLLLLLISAAVQILLTKKPSSAWNLWPGVAWPVWFIYSMRNARASVQLAK